MKFFKLENIVIVEDFRIMDTNVVAMNVVIEMKLYLRSFKTKTNT